MKKKVILIFIFVLTMFVCIGGVKGATTITSFAESASAASSDPCTPTKGGCASTEDIYSHITGPLYGIRASIVNSNGTIKSGTTTKNIWATKAMLNKVKSYVDDNDSKTTLHTISKANNIYVSAIGLPNPGYLIKSSNPYETWFNSLNETKVKAIIKQLGEANINNVKNYYLKVEPIFVVYENYQGTKHYYNAGTASEIMAALNSRTSSSYGPYYVSGGNNNYVGGNWNVIRNYIVAMYFDCADKTTSGLNVVCYNSKTLGSISQKKELKGTYTIQGSSCGKYCLNYIYPGNGLGVGYIQIDKYIKEENKLIIYKTNVRGTTIKGKSATIGVFTNNKCSGSPKQTVKIDGTGKAEDTLAPGTYYLKETSAPKGFVRPDQTKCTPFEIKQGDTWKSSSNLTMSDANITVRIKNTQTCESEFDALPDKKNKSERIRLFGIYGRTNLLNFDEIRTNVACQNATCNYDNKTSCLSGNYVTTTFNDNNWSCKKSEEIINQQTAYCLTTFKFENLLSQTRFGSKSGMLYINSKDFGANIGKGILEKTCYTLGSANSANKLNINYSEYIDSIKFDSKELTYEIDSAASTSTTSGNKYYQKIVALYKLPAVYAKNGSGQYSSTACSTCKFLGYGFVSKFSEDEESNIPFSIKFKSKDGLRGTKKPTEDNDKCKYDPDPEIIISNKPRLVFRNVNTQLTDGKDAFLGKSGRVRDAKSNWLGNEDIIVDTNNSYNKTGEGPKYEIRLTANTIRAIRNYNKDNPYDDYKFTCKPTTKDGVEDGNNVCKSNYLDELKKEYGLKINNSKIRPCIEDRTKDVCEIQ